MLDQIEIRLGDLLYWLGMTAGFGLLVASVLTQMPPLGEAAVAIILITGIHSVRRAVADHDRALREAFQLGRDHERLQNVHSLR